MENTQEDVIVALNTGLQERKIRNLAVLETIVKTVLSCGHPKLGAFLKCSCKSSSPLSAL
jgi:hypothetical protein